jgi:hypothetical protein
VSKSDNSSLDPQDFKTEDFDLTHVSKVLTSLRASAFIGG